MFCGDLLLKLMFSGHLQKDLFTGRGSSAEKVF